MDNEREYEAKVSFIWFRFTNWT